MATRKEMHYRLTPRQYKEWQDYYVRNNLHPKTATSTVALGNLIAASAASGKAASGKGIDDFVANRMVPAVKGDPEGADTVDPDAVMSLFEGMSGGKDA